MERTAELLTLLRQPSTCSIATTMADGSSQLTQTWVDTDDVGLAPHRAEQRIDGGVGESAGTVVQRECQ